jgi:cysteine desulfurase/selenocysteine lyase
VIESLRLQFPLLRRHVHGGRQLVYLDNAATTQKPQVVIDAIRAFYETSNANAHRGGHALGAEATGLYEGARATVAAFLNAQPESIVFTRGATESINLLAVSIERTYGQLLNGRTIVISEMEHHANIVPWQVLCQRTGAALRVIRVRDDGTLDYDHARELIDSSCAVVSVMHMSNVLGTVNNISELCSWARSVGAISIVDGSQFVVHSDVDVQAVGCDAYVFSGHKLYAPFGIGVLYGRYEFLSALEPYQTGGAMIDTVRFDGTTYAEPPGRFEAGTPNIEGAVGLGTAITWIRSQSRVLIHDHERIMAEKIISAVSCEKQARILAPDHAVNGIVSMVFDGLHAQDVGVLLDEQGVAVRTGHHCAMPLMNRFGVSSTLRVSVAAYTTDDDVDRFASAFAKACRMLG